MYKKFIITEEGILKFGVVHMHRDLLSFGETCEYGGGLWQIDNQRNAIVLYGSSYDFGSPDFTSVRKIDWSGLGGSKHPLLYMPCWPDETGMYEITTTLGLL